MLNETPREKPIYKEQSNELPIFVAWMDFLKWLIITTDKFPKKVRLTFTNRINNIALDVVEDLVEAQYSKTKSDLLRRANLKLEKLRVLIRISYEQRFLTYDRYQAASVKINQAGKMLGGWAKQQVRVNEKTR